MKLHFKNLKGRPITWWIGEIIAYIAPTILICFSCNTKNITYNNMLAYFIAGVGLSTTIILIYLLFIILGDKFKKKFVKYK